MRFYFILMCMMPGAVWAVSRTLFIENKEIELFESCSSDHMLNVEIGAQTYCAPLTTAWVDDSLHVEMNNVTYTVCNGQCPGQSDEVPEIPPDPIVMEQNCTWTQTNSNAYLLSDGNQYFDTGVSVNSRNNIQVIAQVVNGKAARIFGTVGSTGCYFDMTLNNAGGLAVRMGNSGKSYTLTSAEQTGKNTYKTESTGTNNNKKKYYVNNRDLTNGGKQVNACSSNSTMWVLNNDYVTINQSLSGEIKLYGIKVWNSAGTLVHEYQPVAKGTNICGYTTPQNGMWDTVSKQFYLAGGSGVMGYGVDN